MSAKERIKHEIKAIIIAMLYFATWIGALLALKTMILAEYEISFSGWSIIIVGALVLSKVVLVLEHVSLGEWVRNRPTWVDVILRTVMYSLGVALVLILEKGIEGWREYGGFVPSVMHQFQQTGIHHVWVNTICLSGALLGYNVLSVLRRHLGPGGLARIFLRPGPMETKPVIGNDL